MVSASAAGQRIAELVAEVADRVRGVDDCPRLSQLLDGWMNERRREIAPLIATLVAGGAAEADLVSQHLIRGYCDVAEVAYECGEDASLVASFETFEALIEQP